MKIFTACLAFYLLAKSSATPSLDPHPLSANQRDSSSPIGVIELRNYVIKAGGRDQFIDYFEKNFIAPQESLHGYLLGQYRVKNSDNNFCWIRGFENMRTRSSFLPAFYFGPVWKQHKAVANSMLANNDNVYLLQPLVLKNDSLLTANTIQRADLFPGKGIAVVDFYIANTRLNELLRLFAREYLPLATASGVQHITLWTSVPEVNDFPKLPVFQDRNLLVTISFFDSERAYRKTIKKIASKTSPALQSQLLDVITTKNTILLYPTEQTINRHPLP